MSDNAALKAEGCSFSMFARVCGLLCFCVINPLFVWIWIDSPKFVQGPIDFPEIFMAIVTLGMLFLGLFGLMINFAKTQVSSEEIRWGIFRNRWLPLDDILYVDRVIEFRLFFIIPAVSVIRLVTTDSQKLEIPGGTEDLLEAFLWVESQYPK